MRWKEVAIYCKKTIEKNHGDEMEPWKKVALDIKHVVDTELRNEVGRRFSKIEIAPSTLLSKWSVGKPPTLDEAKDALPVGFDSGDEDQLFFPRGDGEGAIVIQQRYRLTHAEALSIVAKLANLAHITGDEMVAARLLHWQTLPQE
jgi:hypothetical protein